MAPFDRQTFLGRRFFKKYTCQLLVLASQKSLLSPDNSPLMCTFLQKVTKAMRKGSYFDFKYLFFTTNLAGKCRDDLLEISSGFRLDVNVGNRLEE